LCVESEKVFPGVKIFSLSGNSVERQKEEYSGLHVDAFIQKPFKCAALIKLLNIHLTKPKID
jgi:hypothetical protein